MIIVLFLASIALIAYTLVLFPLWVAARGLFRPRPHLTSEDTPSLSMIIAAHNEAASMGPKLENALSLDYPPDHFEVVVASDGSDDTTEEVTSRYAGRRVRLVSLPRVGKRQALNAAVAVATGDILVFSDANTTYAPGALHALVRSFADPTVGGVAGNQVYLEAEAHEPKVDDEGERGYWNLERMLKVAESRAGNVVSATGAIYAIRRALFRAEPSAGMDDFVISTGVIAQGFRLVFEPRAVAYEPTAGTSRVEFSRKVRIATGGLLGVLTMRELLNPLRYGFYAVQLFSHKVLRRLLFVPLLVLLVTGPLLWERGAAYRFFDVVQACFYACAAAGLVLAGSSLGRVKVFSLAYYFCLVHVACVVAVVNLLRRRHLDRWTTERHGSGERASRKPVPPFHPMGGDPP